MLIAENLSKVYTLREGKGLFSKKTVKQVTAVKEVSLKIEPGKIVGLLGLNGAGKTTTIKMLSGIIEPSSGKITINNIDAVSDYVKIKKFINVISGGERNIYWRLTARENLEYFGALYGISKKELEKKIDYLLNMVGLGEAKDMPVERYSKGMKQRLQIAKGLINDPTYIFLDEPTLGLDIKIAKELRGYIYKVSKESKKGILLTTHYIAEAEELCDYIYIIDKGVIIAEGTPNELKRKLLTQKQTLITVDKFNDTVKSELIEFCSGKKLTISFQEDGDNIIKIMSEGNFINEVLGILEKNNISLISMNVNEPTLEDVLFTSIIEGDNNEKISKNNAC